MEEEEGTAQAGSGGGPRPGGNVAPAAAFALDHVFVAVAPGAPQMDRLVAAGFREGPPNVHPGQGTACRRLFFGNAYLELVWLEDPAEARSETVVRTGLAGRAGLAEGVSRVGIALRPDRDGRRPEDLTTWDYRPPYLPEGVAIPVAVSSGVLAEPLLFVLPWSRAWSPPEVPHPCGAGEVTRVVVTVAGDGPPTPELAWLGRAGLVELERGATERVCVELDGGEGGATLDLRPGAPLLVSW